MRYSEIISEASKVAMEEIPWPTSLVWRIQSQQFKNMEPLLDMRAGKLFAMPFNNWENTFYKLTLKDTRKIKYLKTQVLDCHNDAIVGDMGLIDLYFTSKDDLEQASLLKKYQETSVDYSQFVHNPTMFSKPEILIKPGSATNVNRKLSLQWEKARGYFFMLQDR